MFIIRKVYTELVRLLELKEPLHQLQLSDVIIPTVQLEDIANREEMIAYGNAAGAATTTIYTVPAGYELVLTAFVHSFGIAAPGSSLLRLFDTAAAASTILSGLQATAAPAISCSNMTTLRYKINAGWSIRVVQTGVGNQSHCTIYGYLRSV